MSINRQLIDYNLNKFYHSSLQLSIIRRFWVGSLESEVLFVVPVVTIVEKSQSKNFSSENKRSDKTDFSLAGNYLTTSFQALHL